MISQKKVGCKRSGWVLALCLPLIILVFFVGWAMYCTGIAKHETETNQL
jgi:hypothetical protein